MICRFHSFTLTGRILDRYAGFYDPVSPCVSSDRERIEIVYRFDPRIEVNSLAPSKRHLWVSPRHLLRVANQLPLLLVRVIQLYDLKVGLRCACGGRELLSFSLSKVWLKEICCARCSCIGT